MSRMLKEDQVAGTVVRTLALEGGTYSVTITAIGRASKSTMFDDRTEALQAHDRAVQYARCNETIARNTACPTCSDD